MSDGWALIPFWARIGPCRSGPTSSSRAAAEVTGRRLARDGDGSRRSAGRGRTREALRVKNVHSFAPTPLHDPLDIVPLLVVG